MSIPTQSSENVTAPGSARQRRLSAFDWEEISRLADLQSHKSVTKPSSTLSSLFQCFCVEPIAFMKENSAKRRYMTDIRALVFLRHPNIVTIFGACLQDKLTPWLIMECMPLGSLYNLLRNQTITLEGNDILQIVLDIVRGMSFLHANKPMILHTDLKSVKVLVTDRFEAKISGFGLPKINKPERESGILQCTFRFSVQSLS